MKIGIDLGGSHIGVGVVDENGNILKKWETDLKFKQISNMEVFIQEYILKVIKEIGDFYPISLIGIASPRKSY